MASTRIIDCIGASSTDIVRLGLLLRAAEDRLDDHWEWGPEEEAEVILVDAEHPKGAAALQRCRKRGVYFAELIAPDAPAPPHLYLRRPVEFQDLVDLLNDGMARTVAPLTLISRGENFFEMDLEPIEDDSPLPDFTPPSTASDPLDPQFEELFRRDPLANTSSYLLPGKLSEHTRLEFIKTTTTRSETRADIDRNPFLPPAQSDANVDPSFRRGFKPSLDDGKTHPLGNYLDTALLGGPARIQLPGAPALVLDPKDRLFHAEGRLSALEPYARAPLRIGDWERLTNTEMIAIRQRIPAKPYLRLAFLERFVHSNGYLASHLDPGGSYRLTRWLELAQDYPHAARVARHMMTAQRLGDVAKASELPLAEVFDVINAYDAIGFLEWTHRPRSDR